MAGPTNYLSGLGTLPSPIDAINEQLNQRINRDTALLQQQGMQQKIQQADRDQQRQADFTRAVQGAWTGKNRASDIARTMAEFPEFADELQKSYDLMDKTQRADLLKGASDIYYAMDANNLDLAKAKIKARMDADMAQGGAPDEQDAAILRMIESGDKNQIAAAQRMVGAVLRTAVGPDKWASATGAMTEERGDFTLAAGNMRFGRQGEIIAKAPFAPRPVSVGPNETVIEYQPGGGEPTSSGGQYTGGWTPRARNGGDNPDDAVDNKIVGVAEILGVNPDADISTLSPAQIARALAFGEGGAGTIADRNNNSANLRGTDGNFRRFGTKEDGVAAAASQVARNLKRGQTTVRSMIEGLPVGGSGGPRVLAQGAPKPSYVQLSDAEVQAAGLNPNIKYQRSPDGQITAISGQDTRTSPGRAVPDSTAKRVEGAVAVRDSLRRAVSGFREGYGGNTFTGSAENFLQGIVGTGTPGQRDWWADFYTTDNQIRNDLFGSALTPTEQAAYERTTIAPRMSDKAIQSNLAKRQGIIEGALRRQQNFLKKNKFDAEAVDALYADDPLSSGATSAQPVEVRSKQEAERLPPGTLFTTPDGRTMRRK